MHRWLSALSRKDEKCCAWDVFLSHDWGAHERVKLLHQALKLAGLQAWLDDSNMSGDVVHSMTSGIDDSSLFVACITRNYIDKCAKAENDNCKLELDYAYHRKGGERLVALVLDIDCLDTSTWQGKTGAYLCSRLYLDCTTDAKMIASAIALVDLARNRAEQQKRQRPRRYSKQRVVPL